MMSRTPPAADWAESLGSVRYNCFERDSYEQQFPRTEYVVHLSHLWCVEPWRHRKDRVEMNVGRWLDAYRFKNKIKTDSGVQKTRDN